MTARPGGPAFSGVAALLYLLSGLYFGVVLVKSEAASWYRVQEMFRFQSIHMYGLIGSAVLTGIITTAWLTGTGRPSLRGTPIRVTPKERSWARYVLGGATFGLGWGLSGVCPGPVLALIGAGVWPLLIVLVFALLGTWLYGALRRHLPH